MAAQGHHFNIKQVIKLKQTGFPIRNFGNDDSSK